MQLFSKHCDKPFLIKSSGFFRIIYKFFSANFFGEFLFYLLMKKLELEIHNLFWPQKSITWHLKKLFCFSLLFF